MTRDLMIEARISQEMWVLEAPEKGVSPNKAANAIHATLPCVAVRCKNPQMFVEPQKDPPCNTSHCGTDGTDWGYRGRGSTVWYL